MSSMLPPPLLRLFMPRPPIPHAAPVDKDPLVPRQPRFGTVAEYLERGAGHDADYVRKETVEEGRARRVPSIGLSHGITL